MTQLANVVSGVLAAHGLDREEALYGLHEVPASIWLNPASTRGNPGHSSRAMKQGGTGYGNERVKAFRHGQRQLTRHQTTEGPAEQMAFSGNMAATCSASQGRV